MARSMTPPSKRESEMTDGQIDKAVAIFRAQLRKSRRVLPSDAVQQVLIEPKYGPDLLDFFQQRVEAVSEMIVRRALVDRSKAPQELLDATDRKQYTTASVVESMPRGKGEEVEVCFFRLGRFVSDAKLAEEYERRGLVPDQFAQAQANIDDPNFADEHPNGSHWNDSDDRWCYLAFGRWDGGRRVGVDRNDDDWRDDWWFAGVRKSPARNA